MARSPRREWRGLKGQGQGQGSNEPSRLGIGRKKRIPRRGGKREDTVSWKPKKESMISRARSWWWEPKE